MQPIRLLFLLVLFCSGWTLNAQNQLPNPGFESVRPDQFPSEGWWLYQGYGTPEVKTDTNIFHTGKASVRLQAPDEAKFALVSPKFPVAPYDEIRFEAWLRIEKRQPPTGLIRAGLAFRRADGGVFARHYVETTNSPVDQWFFVSTNVIAPADAVSAEIHVGYNNAKGNVWMDDASAVIANPISLSLIEPPQKWVGRQELSLGILNRQTNQFCGKLRVSNKLNATDMPVVAEPGQATRLRIPTILPGVGAHTCKIVLSDAAGTAIRSLEQKIQTSPALQLYPACPCYHRVGHGEGTTLLDAKIVVEPSRKSGLRFVGTLANATGKVLEQASTDASQAEFASLKFHVPVAQTGSFLITAKLIDANGKELETATTDIHVHDKTSTVQTGPDGFLRIEGKPHFPIGMFSCGQYEEMAGAGFNSTHSYQFVIGEPDEPINSNDATVKRLLDQSWTNGMRLLVELPRKAIEKGQLQQVRRRIETFRHHPGLLCWGSEERVARGEAPLKNIEALYALVHELDPDHPFLLGDTWDFIGRLMKDRRKFFPDQCMDAGIWWWYPIPLRGSTTDGDPLQGREPASTLLQPPSWLTTTVSKKPLWIAIQSYEQPWKGARFPTPEEYRAMAYLSIINGVKGLWFYTGYGQKDWQGKPAGLLNKQSEGHWDYVKKLVGELREFSPVIVASSPKYKLEISPSKAPVEVAWRELDGKLYLLAANKSETEQSLKFVSEVVRGRQAEVMFETHPVKVEGDALADSFGPLGVRVYRFNKPN